MHTEFAAKVINAFYLWQRKDKLEKPVVIDRQIDLISKFVIGDNAIAIHNAPGPTMSYKIPSGKEYSHEEIVERIPLFVEAICAIEGSPWFRDKESLEVQIKDVMKKGALVLIPERYSDFVFSV